VDVQTSVLLKKKESLKKIKVFLVDIVQNVLLPRRDGRAVDCGGLENR
jgi:hypothetical protein